jgi:hypothetical protein
LTFSGFYAVTVQVDGLSSILSPYSIFVSFTGKRRRRGCKEGRCEQLQQQQQQLHQHMLHLFAFPLNAMPDLRPVGFVALTSPFFPLPFSIASTAAANVDFFFGALASPAIKAECLATF